MQKARDGIALNSKDRSNVCEIVITHFLNEGLKLDNQCLASLAESIAKIIPSERKTTYFVEPISKKLSLQKKSQVARGKLVDKHRNKLTALRRTLAYQNLHPPSTVLLPENGNIIIFLYIIYLTTDTFYRFKTNTSRK